jgi:biopolymer transport protein ExbD
MARSLSKSAYRPHPVMNVTPLVDVMLVLLIIFMVVIPMMEKSAKVDLPSIFNVDAEPKTKTDPFTLSIIADGSMFFEQDRMTKDELVERLRKANEDEPTKRLVVRADKETHYGDVRALFKICQEIGFPGVSMRVNELKGSASK